jgi:hypothetical protein
MEIATMHDMSNTRKEIAARLGFAASNEKTRMSRKDGNFFIIRGFVDGEIVTDESVDTKQEAEYYGQKRLDYFKKSNPKAKKVIVEIDEVVNRDINNSKTIKTLSSRPGAKVAFAKWEVTPTKKNGVPIEEHTAKIGIDLWKIDTMPHAGVGVGSLYRWDKLRGLRLVSTGQVDLLKKQAEAISTKKDGISDLMRGFSRPGAKTRMTREQTEEQKAGLKIMSAADPAVGAKIAKLIKEGKPQDQAVAIALDMKRRGEL